MYFFKITLIGRLIENYMDGFTKTFLCDFHRKLVCSMDKWFGKTMEDIREIENQTKLQLENQINDDSLRGITSEAL